MSSETENKKMKKKKKKSIGRILLTIIGFLLLFVCTVALTVAFLTVRPPDVSIDKNAESSGVNAEVENRADGIYNVLVVGTDKVGLNTDTILVASLDTKNDRVSVMSIPRDTMSNVKRSVKKINSAYSVGAKNGVGNIDNLKKEVSYLMGFPMDNYVVIDLTAFEELIDELGGVTIDVPRNMHYDDPYQDLHIHIEKGLQTLNGEEALGFVRYRKDYAEGDLGRVKAQQLFIEALAKQIATPATITKLPQLADIILENMDTDLTYGELAWFGKEALAVDMENNLNMFTLPGIAATVKPDGSYQALSYYLPYEDEILTIVNEYFNPYSTDLLSLNVVDTAALLQQAAVQNTPAVEEPDVSEEENGENIDNAENTDTPDNSVDSESENGSENNNEDNNENNEATGNNETTGTDEGSGTVMDGSGETAGDINGEDENTSLDEPVDPNTQAPDEVLKDDAQQNPDNTDSTVQPENNTDTQTPEQVPETPADTEFNTADETQTGGIPGEVLKSDTE